MSVRYTVISIGTLSRNRLWGERQPARPAHATITLIRDGNQTILVDPSLPPELLERRLDERSGLSLRQIDMVFLTTFRPVHRRGLEALEHAEWRMHETEIEAVRHHLRETERRFREGTEETDEKSSDPEAAEVLAVVASEGKLLERIRPAEDRLTRGVHLFPLPGASPGSAGLLLAHPLRTVLVAGDAVLTRDHAEAGQVFEQSYDVRQAGESLREVLEIADEIVCGHDNVFFALKG